MILNVLCMIMCKRVPEGVVSFGVGAELAKKIKLLPLPRSFGFEPLPGLAKQVSDKGEKPVPAEKQVPSLIE